MGPWPWSSPSSGWAEGCTFRPGKGQGRRTSPEDPLWGKVWAADIRAARTSRAVEVADSPLALGVQRMLLYAGGVPLCPRGPGLGAELVCFGAGEVGVSSSQT